MKNKISIILIVISITLVGLGIYFLLTTTNKKETSDNTMILKTPLTNESYQLSTKHTFEEIDFQGAVIQKNDTKQIFYAYVTNNSEKDIKTKKITILFLDKNNHEIRKIEASISDLKSKDSKQLVVETTFDIFDAYDYKIVKE